MRRILVFSTVLITSIGLLHASLLAQGTQTPPPARATTPPPTPSIERRPGKLKAFTVTLVLGQTEPGPSDTLSSGATKALADLKDFLPYKSFRQLDTAPIIGLGGPDLILRSGDQKFDFGMRCTDLSATTTQVDMLRLWQMAATEDLKKGNGGSMLIDTAFKIDVGETVVVGTSRLDGGKALILLVSAVR